MKLIKISRELLTEDAYVETYTVITENISLLQAGSLCNTLNERNVNSFVMYCPDDLIIPSRKTVYVNSFMKEIKMMFGLDTYIDYVSNGNGVGDLVIVNGTSVSRTSWNLNDEHNSVHYCYGNGKYVASFIEFSGETMLPKFKEV